MDTTTLEISATENGRSFWLGQGLASQNFEKVSAAEVLIVPIKDFRGVAFAFHQDTAAFARYLTKKLAGQAHIEVLADDGEYMEVALHGASLRFSTIVVSSVLAPILINLLSSYIYDELKAKPGDTVEMNIVIEDHDCRAMNVGFKGDAKDFVAVAEKVKQVARECMDSTTRATSHSTLSVGENEAMKAGSNESDDVQF